RIAIDRLPEPVNFSYAGYIAYRDIGKVMDVAFDGAFGGVRDEEVSIREDVVVTSSSPVMLTNSYLGWIMVSLIFLEGLEEEALV
ncbi:hypothetical protein Tco_1514281, partial [Tanacetum coccineum]